MKLTKPPRKPLFRVPVRSRCISYRTRRMQKTHIRFVKHLRKLLILTTVANDLSPSRPDCGSARILFRGTEKSRRGNGPKTRITHEITFPHKPKLIKLRAVKIQRGDSERRWLQQVDLEHIYRRYFFFLKYKLRASVCCIGQVATTAVPGWVAGLPGSSAKSWAAGGAGCWRLTGMLSSPRGSWRSWGCRSEGPEKDKTEIRKEIRTCLCAHQTSQIRK